MYSDGGRTPSRRATAVRLSPATPSSAITSSAMSRISAIVSARRRALRSELDRLVDAGNTVVVVEHDLDVVKHADWVIDLGPEAGRHGGAVVFEGTPAELARASTYTAKYLVRSLTP